jgi:hypothetical protein
VIEVVLGIGTIALSAARLCAFAGWASTEYCRAGYNWAFIFWPTRNMPIEHPGPQSNSNSRRLLITVHGIRTFGRWQERIEELVKRDLGLNTDVRHYRYGFFTILAFLFPPLRWLATRRFHIALLHQLQRESWERVDIVAHSFGTHLVGWGLLRIQEARRPAIHTLIFAGSVLKTSFPVRELVGKSVRRLASISTAQN